MSGSRRYGKHAKQEDGTGGPVSRPAPIAPAPFAVATGLLVICVVMSFMLSLDHLGSLSLPGCGPGSPCAKAAASVWGRVPYLNWPVSFIGLAYFFAMLAVWVAARGRLPSGVRNLVRAGVLVSLGFIVLLIVGRHACYYCLGAHAANLGFWLVMERSKACASASWRSLGAAAAVFLVVSAALGGAEWRHEAAAKEKAEKSLAASTAEMIGATSRMARHPSGQSHREGFTGRWRLGPEKAPIRLVVISDYQCVDCFRIEGEIRELLAQRSEVSLSMKHFPMCTECNRRLIGENMHPHACRAARAAEAAGILLGNSGFWDMHHWVFDQKGVFTDDQVESRARELGCAPTDFVRVMNSEETLRRVQADVEEAYSLGLHFTPMIFINGVELKGWNAKNAVARAVAALAARNPPAMTAELDNPPQALAKHLADWREQPVRTPPPRLHMWPRGPDNARVKIVLFGDYQEPFTAEADGIIRAAIAGGMDIQYSFRHYPFHRDCNPNIKTARHPLACLASAAAEAAGLLKGRDGYWKMHDWLMGAQKRFSETVLRQAVTEMGFSADAFFETMKSAEVSTGISQDVVAGKQMNLQSIPMIFVNGRFLPRWRRQGEPVLQRVLEVAARSATPGAPRRSVPVARRGERQPLRRRPPPGAGGAPAGSSR